MILQLLWILHGRYISGGSVTDLAPLADVAHGAGVPLIVDNTMATPFLTRPFEHGADVICHSTVSHALYV